MSDPWGHSSLISFYLQLRSNPQNICCLCLQSGSWIRPCGRWWNYFPTILGLHLTNVSFTPATVPDGNQLASLGLEVKTTWIGTTDIPWSICTSTRNKSLLFNATEISDIFCYHSIIQPILTVTSHFGHLYYDFSSPSLLIFRSKLAIVPCFFFLLLWFTLNTVAGLIL